MSNVVALLGSLTGVKVTIPSSGSSFRLAIPLMSYFFSALILPKSKLSCPISILVWPIAKYLVPLSLYVKEYR